MQMASRTVSVSLVADVGQYQSAMTRAAASTRTVGQTAQASGTQAQRGFAAAATGAKLLAGVAGGALAIGLKGTIDLASEAEQSLGGVQAVFKDYANTVIADSKAADRALGLSANSYRELATLIGAQLKNAGVPMDELAEKTDGLITMGADLAAMFGGTTQEAVEALSSALKGEMDPIEKYGISLNDAALKAEAAALGLEVMGGSLTTSQRAMAVMSAVTKQGSDAIGAFGREQDTAAGRAARAAAQWENLQTEIGEKLLPAWSGLMDFVGTSVIPGLEKVGGAVGDVIGWLKENEEVAITLAAVLAVQLAGGVAALVVQFNRLILTNAVIGLSNVLGIVGNLPRALGTAAAAVGGFMAAVAPLLAIGVVVYGITKLVETAQAAGNARKEIAAMWDAVDDSRGSEQIDAVGRVVDQLREKVAQARSELEGPRGFWNALLFGPNAEPDTSALDEYEAALLRAEAAQELVEGSADRMGQRFGLTRDQVLDLASKYDIDLTGSMDNTFRLMQNYYAMEFGAKPTEATIAVSNAFDDAKTAVDEAKKAVDQFKLSLDILTGAHVSMIAVESAFEAAVDSADGALKDLNGSVLNASGGLNLQSEAGRTAADILLDVRDSGNQLIATMIQQGESADVVKEKDAELRASFYETMKTMGIEGDAADILAEQILGIPAERETKIDADTQAALDKINGVQTSVDNLEGKTIEIRVRAAGRFIINPNGGLQEFGGPDAARDFAGLPGYMRGGWTGPGPASKVAGLAHADEFVVPKHRVNALGGPGAVASRVGMGRDIGGPANIDLVHDTRHLESSMESLANAMKNATPKAGVAGTGAVSGAWGSIWQYVKARVPAARINSTFRAGDPGYHGRGKAIDFGYGSGPGGLGSAGLALINRVLHDGIGRNLAELIYDGIGDDRPDLKNGRPLAYSAATQAQHRNHVHAAVYDQGGWLQPGLTLAYNGTGSKERVLTSREYSGGGGGAGGSADISGLAAKIAAILASRPTVGQIVTQRNETGFELADKLAFEARTAGG